MSMARFLIFNATGILCLLLSVSASAADPAVSNAAPETGETASSHLAGVTVHIQRRGMTRQQVKWVEQYMMPLKDLGLIEPEEERRQWVFHVMVSDHYSDWRESKMLAGEEQQEYEERAPDLTSVAGARQR